MVSHDFTSLFFTYISFRCVYFLLYTMKHFLFMFFIGSIVQFYMCGLQRDSDRGRRKNHIIPSSRRSQATGPTTRILLAPSGLNEDIGPDRGVQLGIVPYV